ncbi:aminotransferase class V-fold PLP-dependent enzyme [Rhizosaccharibacter radicis]|uniref:Aminotransferase class V-fold PLP-dependent enzyme n=1 Tax=Rhizosaccharibacter radicis TaxID=2782605 RepID=A0ABT1W0B2_9PROT|nr:aminotransferase class V-fold PLP-dependent enzyme [Acetobacteraceae bacterium KSS12]
MIPPLPRRRLLGAAAPVLLASSRSAVAAGIGVPNDLPATPLPARIPVSALPAQYDVAPDIHNLENGYWGIMPRVVADTYARHQAEVNRDNSIWARNVLPGGACLAAGGRDARAAIARQVGCSPEEIAVTRSGSDALQMLITNYRPLKPGDAVIHCDLDYDAMIAAMDWLGTRRGAEVVKFSMPEPATTANILQAYRDVLARTPRAKLLLVTQVSNRTGLVTPVREIVAMARERGVDTVVDAAHGIACLDFRIGDLGADFAGWSVHKWTSAPLGTGAMFIRRERIPDIDVAFDNHEIPPTEITARVPAGTVDFAAVLTIPTAVDFHFAVGAAEKERHLRALRDRWVEAVRDVPEVELCVPDDPARYCTITSFRLRGMRTAEDARRLQHVLLERHRIHTVWRKGVARGPVIRVTPGLYSTMADADALSAALQQERRMFV